MVETLATVEMAKTALEDVKGEDLVVLDVANRSSITGYYLIASGTSMPHLKAMGREVEQALKKDGVRCLRRAGDPEGGWLVLDYGDLIIHMFLPEQRRYYALESLWSPGALQE